MLVHLLHGKEINPSSLDSADLFQYFWYRSTVCAIGLLIRPTLGANVNKGFNYSRDVPGIACCCPVNPSSSLICGTKRHLFPGAGGNAPCAEQGSLCWPGFVWERAPGEWQPGLKISLSFWELSFPSKLLSCCNFRSQVFPLTGNGATLWGRTWGSECPAGLTGNSLMFYRALKCRYFTGKDTTSTRQFQLCSQPQTPSTLLLLLALQCQGLLFP